MEGIALTVEQSFRVRSVKCFAGMPAGNISAGMEALGTLELLIGKKLKEILGKLLRNPSRKKGYPKKSRVP